MSKELTTTERAFVCMSIMKQLTAKLEEFYELYNQLSTTYDEEITDTGISVLAVVDAIPTPDVDGVITVGTHAGVLNALCDLFNNCAEQLEISKEDLAKMLVHGLKKKKEKTKEERRSNDSVN